MHEEGEDQQKPFIIFENKMKIRVVHHMRYSIECPRNLEYEIGISFLSF